MMKNNSLKFLTLRNSKRVSKKAQGISINVIIIAAIALVVLIVVVFIFTDKISDFGKGLKAIEKCPGSSTCKYRCVGDTVAVSACKDTNGVVGVGVCCE